MQDKLSASRKFLNSLLDNPLLRNLIPNPGDYPEIIYKFRNWKEENHQKLLTHNELYMSPAKFFNDPYDLKIYKNFLSLDTPEKIKKYVDTCMKNHSDWIKREKKNPIVQRKILESRVSNILKYQVRSEVIEDIYNNKNYGTACFSKDWKSILMWSHYSDNHKGYCLGFDEPRMRISGLFGKGGDVTYSAEYPNISPYETDYNAQVIRTYIKSDLWKYENEYRFMNIYFDSGGAEDNSPKRIIKFPENFIKEILLGASMPEKDRDTLVGIGKERGIPIFQVEKISFLFELDRHQVF